MFGDSPAPNTPPQGPTPPPQAAAPTQAAATGDEQSEEDLPEEKASSEVFDLISKRVHQCGSDPRCTMAVGKQLEAVNDASVKALIPVINGSASVQIRAESMRMLAQRKIEEAGPALTNVLLKEKEHELQEAAALALRDIGDPATVPALTKALENAENFRLREVFIQALGGFQTAEAVEALVTVGDGAGRDLFLTTVAALSSTRHESAIPFLTKAANNGDVIIQLEAVNAMSGILSVQSEAALEVLESNPKLAPRVRARVKASLESLRNELALQRAKAKAEREEAEEIPTPPVPKEADAAQAAEDGEGEENEEAPSPEPTQEENPKEIAEETNTDEEALEEAENPKEIAEETNTDEEALEEAEKAVAEDMGSEPTAGDMEAEAKKAWAEAVAKAEAKLAGKVVEDEDDIVSIADYLADYSSYRGKEVKLEGHLITMGETAFLYESFGSAVSVTVDIKKLKPQVRGGLMRECGSGCSATLVGKPAKIMTLKGLRVTSVVEPEIEDEPEAKEEQSGPLDIPSFIADYKGLKGKTVEIEGHLIAMGDTMILYEEMGSVNFIYIDSKKLPKDDKRTILGECGSGCDIIIIGKPRKVMMNKGLRATGMRM